MDGRSLDIEEPSPQGNELYLLVFDLLLDFIVPGYDKEVIAMQFF